MTGNACAIAAILAPHVARVSVVSPGDTGIRQARDKTDRLEAGRWPSFCGPAALRRRRPKRSDPSNLVTLSDVYFRVGGPHVGRADIAIEVNSDDVLTDLRWIWRADHGVEGSAATPSDGTRTPAATASWSTATT